MNPKTKKKKLKKKNHIMSKEDKAFVELWKIIDKFFFKKGELLNENNN